MKAVRILMVTVFLFSGFFLVGCSSPDEDVDSSSSDVPTTEQTTIAPSTDTDEVLDSSSTTSTDDSMSDREKRKAEVRDRILSQREQVQAAANDDAQLVSTGVGFDVFVPFAVFAALLYIGVRRKYFVAQKDEVTGY